MKKYFKANLHTQCRGSCNLEAEAGQSLCSGTLDLSRWLRVSGDDPNAFLRLTFYAPDGTFAATRACWRKEL